MPLHMCKIDYRAVSVKTYLSKRVSCVGLHFFFVMVAFPGQFLDTPSNLTVSNA